MSEIPDITLRYFDCRGRGQFARYYFGYRDIPFVDERVPLSADFNAWQEIRDDRSIAGPFHKLPVLHWGDRVIGETMVIKAFLHDILGDAKTLTDEENLHHAMLTSAAYHDIAVPVFILIWSDVRFEGLDLAAYVDKTRAGLQSQLVSIEKTLNEWRWLDNAEGRSVMVADCVLWEALDVANTMFGDRLSFDATETVEHFYYECPARASFEQFLREHPCPLTGRSGEAEAIKNIQSLLI